VTGDEKTGSLAVVREYPEYSAEGFMAVNLPLPLGARWLMKSSGNTGVVLSDNL
jgi:hypothetical protein